MQKFLLLLLFILAALNSWALDKPYQLTGDVVQGGLIFGSTTPYATVTLENQPVKVTPAGKFVLGFGRDAPSTQTLTVTTAQGKFSQTLTVKARDYNIQRITGIDKKIMQPSAATLERIRAEAQQVRKARAKFYDREDFLQSFQWPLLGPITGVYGSQRVYNGKPGRPHYGIDIAAETGTPITTPVAGVVTLAHPDMFYSGGTLIIDHGYGVSSTMLHLSKLLVKVGDEVKPGDIIGEVGAGGRATGPHLDWRMNWYKARIDPQLLVPSMNSLYLHDGAKTKQ